MHLNLMLLRVMPNSSCTSRAAVCSGVSPNSMWPPGSFQAPFIGSVLRFSSSMRSPFLMRTDTPTMGLGFSSSCSGIAASFLPLAQFMMLIAMLIFRRQSTIGKIVSCQELRTAIELYLRTRRSVQSEDIHYVIPRIEWEKRRMMQVYGLSQSEAGASRVPYSLAHCSNALRISGISCSLVDQLTNAARMAGFPAKTVAVTTA